MFVEERDPNSNIFLSRVWLLSLAQANAWNNRDPKKNLKVDFLLERLSSGRSTKKMTLIVAELWLKAKLPPCQSKTSLLRNKLRLSFSSGPSVPMLVAVASFSSQFLVLLSSLKLNEWHRHFLTHTWKHSFQIKTFKASKTYPARDKLCLASVLRDKDFFSRHSIVQCLFEDERAKNSKRFKSNK